MSEVSDSTLIGTAYEGMARTPDEEQLARETSTSIGEELDVRNILGQFDVKRLRRCLLGAQVARLSVLRAVRMTPAQWKVLAREMGHPDLEHPPQGTSVFGLRVLVC